MKMAEADQQSSAFWEITSFFAFFKRIDLSAPFFRNRI